MFIKVVAKKFDIWKNRREKHGNVTLKNNVAPEMLSKSLAKNISYFKEILGTSDDVKMHEFLFGETCGFSGVLVYIDGLVNSLLITESIMKPLILNKDIGKGQDENPIKTIEAIQSTMLCSGDITESKTLSELVNGCLSGDTVLMVDGFDHGLIISTKGWEKRTVTEPQTELVVRGPREGFTENLLTNTSLLRRKIKSSRLKMEHMTIGKKTGTNICIVFLEGVAKTEIIEMVKNRLNKLNVDSILDSGYIEQYIEDAPFSVFSTIGYSEKPDVVAAKVLEGRVAIVVDGSPTVLTVPFLFIESFQTAEDYYVRPFYASAARLMRFVAYFVTIFSVPIYISLTTHHQELLPTTLLFTIASAREGTPFPALVEGFIMLFSFEILREAGLRLPRPVGQAISIVGALIMGDAAVAAGLVGAPMVIAVAIAAVASFVIPQQIDSVSILRVTIMVLSSAFGGFGITMGFLGVLVHLATLKSFGVNYFDSVLISRDQQDSFIRLPLWTMSKRPKDIAGEDQKRRDTFVPPP